MKTINTRLFKLRHALCIGLTIFCSHQSSADMLKDTKNNQFSILQKYLKQERLNAGLQTKTLKVGDINWTYNEGGNASKPTVLLIHGLAGTRDHWNRVAHYLTPYYHVIAPDLPTNGDTTSQKALTRLFLILHLS